MALRVLLLLALAWLPLGGPAARQDPTSGEAEDPRALLQRAVGLQQEGRSAEAAELYERVVARVGPDPRVLSNLAAAYSSLGRFDEAIARYRRALEGDPSSPSIRLNLALALSKAGRVGEAADEASAVVGTADASRAAVLFLADCYLRLGRSADVVALLDPRIDTLGDSKAFSYLLGMALLREGDAVRAQALIDRVLQDGSPEAHVMLALMHSRRGDCDEALRELDLALAAGRPLPTASFLRGQCLMEEKHWAGAEAAFREELGVDPNHIEAQLLLAGLLFESGRKDEARPHAERALELRPGDPAARLIQGRLLLSLGRTEEAVPHLEAAGAAFPDDKKTHLNLAVAYHRLGRSEDAERERQTVARIEREAQARASASVREAVFGAGESPTPSP